MTAPTVDETLLDLWREPHDDDTPDTLAAATAVDTRIAMGVATYEPLPDGEDLIAAL